MFVRTRYQYGSLRLRKRERGPDVWEFRYYETDSQGERKRQSVILGDRNLYVTETQARKATQALLLRLNEESPRAEVEAATFGALIDRYVEKKFSERYSTRKSHLSNIRVHIRPRWGEYPVDKIKPMAMDGVPGSFCASLNTTNWYERSFLWHEEKAFAGADREPVAAGRGCGSEREDDPSSLS